MSTRDTALLVIEDFIHSTTDDETESLNRILGGEHWTSDLAQLMAQKFDEERRVSRAQFTTTAHRTIKEFFEDRVHKTLEYRDKKSLATLQEEISDAYEDLFIKLLNGKLRSKPPLFAPGDIEDVADTIIAKLQRDGHIRLSQVAIERMSTALQKQIADLANQFAVSEETAPAPIVIGKLDRAGLIGELVKLFRVMYPRHPDAADQLGAVIARAFEDPSYLDNRVVNNSAGMSEEQVRKIVLGIFLNEVSVRCSDASGHRHNITFNLPDMED